MKKKTLLALGCAVLMMLSSLNVMAAKQEEVLEEPEEKPSGEISSVIVADLAKVQFVDEDGKPIPGLFISKIENETGELMFYTESYYSDLQGCISIYIMDENFRYNEPVKVYVINPIHPDLLYYNTKFQDKNHRKKLSWIHETPKESIENTKAKITLRVIDQKGNPVQNARIVMPFQKQLILTDKNGVTHYVGNDYYEKGIVNELKNKNRIEIYYNNAKGEPCYKQYFVSVSDQKFNAGKTKLTLRVTI